jgi:hypothetical protein
MIGPQGAAEYLLSPLTSVIFLSLHHNFNFNLDITMSPSTHAPKTTGETQTAPTFPSAGRATAAPIARIVVCALHATVAPIAWTVSPVSIASIVLA